MPKIKQPARGRAGTLSPCFYFNLCALQLPEPQVLLWGPAGCWAYRVPWTWVELEFGHCGVKALATQLKDQTDPP